ncbi:MAG: isoprenylcysteine carboxylmethyltransferase family protein [Candidatus Lokiarchaeia archaeon]
MYIWFFICVVGMIATIPFRFLSVEHIKLQEKYGKEKGIRIGEICGIVQGWAFFIFWMGIWISPQPSFTIPILENVSFFVPFINFSIPVLHLIISIPFFVTGAWLGIKGVQGTTLKVAETHRTEKIVTSGVYSIVRHPQYLGGLLSHVGISFLLSAWYSLIFTIVMVVLIYIISWKEEKELIKEFGKEYEDYKKKVPMLIPGLKRLRK